MTANSERKVTESDSLTKHVTEKKKEKLICKEDNSSGHSIRSAKRKVSTLHEMNVLNVWSKKCPI